MRKYFGHFGGAIDPLLVVHRHVDNLEVQLAGTKQQLIVTPEILDAPISQILFDSHPVFAPKNFRSTERVFDSLIQ